MAETFNRLINRVRQFLRGPSPPVPTPDYPVPNIMDWPIPEVLPSPSSPSPTSYIMNWQNEYCTSSVLNPDITDQTTF